MKIHMIISFLFISLTSSGTTYYVRNGGNDSNSGLSDAQAWAHHPWMTTWTGSIALIPGDSVCMKRGDTWSIANPTQSFMIVKQSGNKGNYITTTAYGTGAKPIIEISTKTDKVIIYDYSGNSYIILDNLDIRHWSSTKNTSYSAVRLGQLGEGGVSHDWIITNCDIHNCPGFGINVTSNAYNITIGDSTATSTATPMLYSNHIYDCGYCGVGFDGCDPITGTSNYKVYYNYIHDININGAERDLGYGISFCASGSGSGLPKYCYSRYNYIANVPSWTGLDTHNAQYIYFQDNYLNNCLLYFGCQAQILTTLDHLYIERNIIETPVDFKFNHCYFIHVNGFSSDNRATNIYIRDNAYSFTARPAGNTTSYGIKITEVDSVLIEGNHIYNGPLASSTNGAINMLNDEKNVTIRNNFIHDWSPAIYLSPDAIDGDIIIYNNIILSQNRGILCWSSVTEEFIGNISIFNNSILGNPLGPDLQPISFRNTAIPSGSSLKIKNNIIGFITSTSLGRYILAPGINGGTLEIDYNLYWNSTRSDPFYLQGTYNWAKWNNLGYDMHSLYNTDPLFRNLSGSYSEDTDFELQSNSPAIDKGTYVGLLTDYRDLPINGIPDIGAFENQAGSYTPSLINSIIENWSPKTLEMNFNSLLNDKQIPDISSFIVNVNGSSLNINNVSVESNKVLLSLSNTVTFGDDVTVSYNMPETNWIESNSGNPALAITNQPVINNCRDPSLPNKLPIINISFSPTVFSGFVYDLDASASSDAENDKLTFLWSAPQNFPVSSLTGPLIKFLTPVVTKSEILTFSLKVTDGTDTVSHNFEVSLLPFKPSLSLSKVRVIEASDYHLTDYPNNVSDGDLSTFWSVDGDNHWLNISLQEPYEISYIQIALLPDQKYESYFDIYASKDNITWEPIILNAASCGFSGALQNFEFPAEKSDKDFLYVKLVGHGTSINSSNNYSEVKIFGQPSTEHNSNDGNISLFPNPVKDNINILILEPTSDYLQLKLFDFGGRLCKKTLLNPLINNIQIPLNLPEGPYIVQIVFRNMIVFSEKIIVLN